MLGIYANYSLLNSLVTNSGRILKKKSCSPRSSESSSNSCIHISNSLSAPKRGSMAWSGWYGSWSHPLPGHLVLAEFTSDLMDSGPLSQAPVPHRVQNFLKGSHSPNKLSQLQALPEHSMLCCHLSTCQSSGHPFPCNKPYSFQSRLKGMHVHPPVVPKSLQLEGIWKRATYPPFHREPWAVPQHSAGVQGLALDVWFICLFISGVYLTYISWSNKRYYVCPQISPLLFYLGITIIKYQTVSFRIRCQQLAGSGELL